MNLLFLTPQLPWPPDRGTAMRNWGLLRELAKRHRVAVLSFTETAPGVVPDPLREVTRGRVETVPAPQRGLAVRLRDMLLRPRPDMALRLADPGFAARLRAWLAREDFDVVQIEGIELAPYLDDILAARGRAGRPLAVFDDHNAEWVLQQRAFATDVRRPQRAHAALYSLVQWRRLRRYEASVCRRSDRVVAVSATDAAALRALDPQLRVHVVPNGIDLAQYAPSVVPAAIPFDVLFTGKMDFRPNIDAMLWCAAEIWPRVRAACPQATLGIVGQKPHARLDPLREQPGITLTGYVPDIRPYLAGARVYVAPLRMGGGTRFKLLEAMAMERAIVSTRVGAEGLDAGAGILRVAEEPSAFAAQVIDLLQDPAACAGLGTRARAHVAARFDWSALVPRLEAVY